MLSKVPSKKIFNHKAHVSLLALAITVVTFLVYLPALQNNFINWDDDLYVYNNPNIKLLNLYFLKWVSTAIVIGNWHPLTMLSYALDYQLWGLDPWGYHLINNIFHALNTTLAFILAVRLIRISVEDNGAISKYAVIAGTVTAILFGINPIHVESVAWVSERKDVLCAFFYLLSLLAYLRYANKVIADNKFFYFLSILSFMLALLSKPMAVSLPLVLIILDYYPLRRFDPCKRGKQMKDIVIEKIPFFLFSLISSVITVWASHSGKVLWTMKPVSTATHIATSAFAYISYLIKMLLPFNLAPLYLHPVEMNFFRDGYLISIITFLLITTMVVKLIKRNKLFLTVWLYYIITLIPVIGIVQAGEQITADRYTYLPSLGPFLLAGLGIAHLYKTLQTSKKILLLLLLLVMTGIMSYKTIKQIDVWHDSVNLWTHEIKFFPDKVYVVYSGRGSAYAELGKADMAMKDFNMAIKISPTTANAYFNRGTLLLKQGDYSQAINDFSKSIELDTKYIDAYINRGISKRKLGHVNQAIYDYNIAIQLNPGDASLYVNRGNAHFSLSNYEASLLDYKKALKLNPEFAQVYYAMGLAYYELGDFQKAKYYRTKATNMGLR